MWTTCFAVLCYISVTLEAGGRSKFTNGSGAGESPETSTPKDPLAVVENLVERIGDRCVKTMNYWDQLRNYLQQKVSTQEYENWLRGTAFLGIRDGALSVSVSDPQTRSWLE